MPGTPRFKLIALDLDGTTLNPRGTVSPRTRDAIHALLAKGVYVLFATGRNYTECKAILQQARHYPRCVFVGGASLVDTNPASPRLLHSVRMHPELAREICADIRALDQTVLALEETFTTGIDYLITRGGYIDPATADWLKVTKATVRYEDALDTYPHEHTLRVGVIVTSSNAEKVVSVLESKYAGRAVLHAIAVASEGIHFVEIFDPQVSKWQGIERIAGEMGITREEIVAVGDDVNDVPMLRSAGLSAAMGNGNIRAKQAAQITIGTNADDGLAVFLEQLLKEDRIAAA